MLTTTKVLHDIKNHLFSNGDDALYEGLQNLPCTAKHLFKNNHTVSERVEKTIRHIDILNHLVEAKNHFENNDFAAGQAFFNKAVNLQGKKLKVEQIVYKQMEELLGDIKIENLGSQVFNAPTTLPVLKTLSLDAAIQYYQKYWAKHVLDELEAAHFSVNETKNNWQKEYHKLVEYIKKRNVSPVDEDNPEILKHIVATFSNLFDNIPESERKEVLAKPLFIEDRHNPEWTRPLNYVMFVADLKTLEKIEKYLDNEDWLARGPHDSTFAHCIIAGVEKNCSLSPVKCLKKLLTKFPSLKTTPNIMDSTPKHYLEHVFNNLKNDNLLREMSAGGSLFSRPHVNSIYGGTYPIGAETYSWHLRFCKNMLELLE